MNNIADDRLNYLPNEVQLVIYATSRKLVAVIDDCWREPLGMEYEWNDIHKCWDKVVNLGYDIESIKRKYGV